MNTWTAWPAHCTMTSWVEGSSLRAQCLLILAACGDDYSDDDDTGAAGTTGASSTTSAQGGSDWCEELDTLERSQDFSEVDIADAPDEIRGPLEELAASVDLEPATAPPGTLGRLLSANAAVESWDHEHCDGNDPFCSLWVIVESTIAGKALSGGDQQDVESFLDEVDDLLTDYVPAELRDELATALAFTSATSDEDERAAEAATDALDEWARSDGCPGAPPPAEPE